MVAALRRPETRSVNVVERIGRGDGDEPITETRRVRVHGHAQVDGTRS